ncbi:hypothetical protein KPC_2976 [Acinetobacter stercoris]|uniref:Uncharacterized protein n=1 Tax=Acinetobacter stercoris TaxID=2126983 RepID=A0A2U3N2A1_9GAMM|nr:hypothetical protein KPC_2976 [Acinetobacter stercoris]
MNNLFYYGVNVLPYEILKVEYHKSPLKKVSLIEANISKCIQDIEMWEASFQEKIDAVKRLEIKLEQSKSQYDFVLLNEGFKNLYDQKKNELENKNFFHLFFIAIITLLPIINLLTGSLFVSTQKINLMSILLLEFPILTLLFILIYFFRINLKERSSIQSQMMQLELRMALCQFIHNYAEDSEEMHKKNKDGFTKFENIIFSPIVSSDDKIPSTFDGMDQLAKLIEVIKK